MQNDVPVFYLVEEVAKILKCSKWWVQEEVRNGRLPHCRVAGSYRFTRDHLWEIARILERPAAPVAQSPTAAPIRPRVSPRTRKAPSGADSLIARIPARERRAAEAA